jgi:integrase
MRWRRLFAGQCRVSVLRSAKARYSAERLALGGGAFEYVVSNEAGEPYSPAVLSRYWRDAVKAAGVRRIKLHGPTYVRDVDAPTGCPRRGDRGMDRHKDASLTMRLYAHSQSDALKTAAESLNRVVTFCDTEGARSNDSNSV